MSNIVKILLIIGIVGLILGIICIVLGNISVASIVWAVSSIVAIFGYRIEKNNKNK